MSNVLGLDIGERKVGVAVGNRATGFAFARPALLVQQIDDIWPMIAAIITQDEIVEIIVGLPVNDDQTVGPQAERVRTIAKALERFKLPVRLRSEHSTSQAVQREQRAHDRKLKRGEEDSLVAQLLLESYFHETTV